MRSGLSVLMVWVVGAALFAVCLGRYDSASAEPAEVNDQPSVWVRPTGGEGSITYLRKRLNIDMEVERAWATVQVEGGFVLYVNGDAVLKDEYWRPTRPAGNGLNAWGQRLYRAEPAIGLNFPREYQWGDVSGVSTSPVADLTPYLQLGENVITLVVEARTSRPAASIVGEVRLSGSSVYSLGTETEWLVTTAPLDVPVPAWISGEGGVINQSGGGQVGPPALLSFRSASTAAYGAPFHAQWITVAVDPGGHRVKFEGGWQVDEPGGNAWVRVLADRPYQLSINGVRHRGFSRQAPSLSSGEWIYGTRGVRDEITRPRSTDPEEVQSPFELARRADDGQWRPSSDLHLGVPSGSRTDSAVAKALAERAVDHVGRFLEEASPEFSRPYRSSATIPREGPSRRSSFCAHDVTGMLRAGRNTIEVLVASVGRDERSSGELGVAIDAYSEGSEGSIHGTFSSSDWQASTDGVALTDLFERGGAALRAGECPLQWLPRANRLGSDYSPLNFGRVAAWALFLLVWVWSFALSLGWSRLGPTPLAASTLASRVACLLLVPLAVIGLSLGLAEMREGWFFAMKGPWMFAIFVCAFAPVISWALPRTPHRSLAFGRLPMFYPGGRRWGWVVGGIGLLALILRVWAISDQPLDDDEYASVQAIRSIVATGAPGLDSGVVYYTRGPLYHYLVAGFVLLLGDAVWVFRLPSALFALGTGLLLYRIGAKYTRSQLFGAAAFLLFAVHPYCVFTGHVARFYQQQQFFALLTCYLLVEGFIRSGTGRVRLACVLASVASVLTQEISVIIGAQIAIAFLFFRGRRPLVRDGEVIVAASLGAFLVALDYAAFQVLCLTLTEGVSANVEAKLSPNVGKMFNVAALFLGYSRIHVLGTLFLLPSLAAALSRGSRAWLGMHYVLLTGVLLSNVLITHVSLRYQYWLIPVWILLVCHGVLVSSAFVGRALAAGPVMRRRMAGYIQLVSVVTVVLTWAPWRIPSSYSTSILGDSTGALSYVSSRMAPGDRVFVTEPHSHAALAETGRVDGYLSFPLLHDFHVSVNGEVVDRNGGAPVIKNLGELQAQLAKPGRIWIAVNREKWRGRAKNLRWEYPGARAELFLRENCSMEHQAYLWDVYLWDPDRGEFRPFDVAMK